MTGAVAIPRQGRGTFVLFAVTIFVSAFLLFQLQPLIGKYILPWFGGSPATWTTCVLFFQSLLLLGYAYAHFTTRHLSPRVQGWVHVGLLGVALCLLPVTPSASWEPAAGANPVGRILLLLTVTVGLPYTLLSSTGPLLQAWVARVAPDARVYRLYALSNVASFLALLSYPFLAEPLLSRRTQSLAWSGGMVGFAALCAACAYRSGRAGRAEMPTETPGEFPRSSVYLWLLLPACASLLLLAVTNKICQDVAVVPLLWVLPLAIYLLSFVITFDSPRWYDRRVWLPAYFAALAFACYVAFPGNEDLPIPTRVGAYAGVLLGACVICHGELYRLRPDPRYLTGYYLTISAGGALGGLFVALLAPLVFTGYTELPVGLALSYVLLCVVLAGDVSTPLYRFGSSPGWLGLIVGAAALVLLLWSSVTSHLANAEPVVRSRNFYGTLTVYRQPPGESPASRLLLHHAGITHGLQMVGSPELRRVPTAYYGPESGVGLAFRSLHPPAAGAGAPKKIGVIGLGAGTLATYAAATDSLRFYEINPAVIELAQTRFSFLKDSAAREVVTVAGDARLSLEHEQPQGFSLLVLDAFSGDAIPVHLLTAEAFDAYLRHLKPDGIIAVHISNQHLDLEPVVRRLAGHAGLSAVIVHHVPGPVEAAFEYESIWVLLLPRTSVLEVPLIAGLASPTAGRRQVPLWTDDYSNLLQILR